MAFTDGTVRGLNANLDATTTDSQVMLADPSINYVITQVYVQVSHVEGEGVNPEIRMGVNAQNDDFLDGVIVNYDDEDLPHYIDITGNLAKTTVTSGDTLTAEVMDVSTKTKYDITLRINGYYETP